MNRIDRLHAILTHLQSKKLVTAQEIADRFKISLRTVYRDVKALDESGIPVIGEAGSGYSIMEGYRLPPVMFTQEEASALLLGAKLAEHFTDASIRKQYDSALFKIKAVIRGVDKDYVENLEEHVAVFRSGVSHPELNDRFIGQLQKAIVEKKVVHLVYMANHSQETTERDVEPIGLCYYGESWHLIGWCRLRSDYRDFRLNRIKRMEIKETSFAEKQHRSLQEYINDMIVQSSGELEEIVVEFDKAAARFISNQKYYYGYVREERDGDVIRMYFVTSFPMGFARWLLMFINSVRILTPQKLNTMMQGIVEQLSQHYLVNEVQQ